MIDRKAITEFIDKSLATLEIPVDVYERQSGCTPVIINNEDEIYLLVEDENGDTVAAGFPGKKFKKERICGHPRSNIKVGLRCRQSAGWGTNHVGYGKCCYHEKIAQGHYPNLRVIRGLVKKGFALDLADFNLVCNELLTDEYLAEVREEIIVLTGLLREAMNKEVYDTDEILKILDSMIKAKAVKSKIETEKLLIDKNSINLFVGLLFEVLKSTLGSGPLYSEVMLAFKQKLAFPINQSMRKMIEEGEVKVEVLEE